MFISTLLTTALALSTAAFAAPANNGNGNANGHDKDKKGKHDKTNGTCPLTAVDPVEFPYPSESGWADRGLTPGQLASLTLRLAPLKNVADSRRDSWRYPTHSRPLGGQG